MRTRTWLTSPVDQAPAADERSADGERYVPGPGLPSEPRVPARHRGLMLVITALAIGIVVLSVLVIRGQEGQREDPSVPEGPEGPGGEQPLELPDT